MKDYLLSNDYWYNSPGIQAWLASLPEAQRVIYNEFTFLRPSYLRAGLDEVESQYGTMENYVITGLGVSPDTVKALKKRMLSKGVN